MDWQLSDDTNTVDNEIITWKIQNEKSLITDIILNDENEITLIISLNNEPIDIILLLHDYKQLTSKIEIILNNKNDDLIEFINTINNFISQNQLITLTELLTHIHETSKKYNDHKINILNNQIKISKNKINFNDFNKLDDSFNLFFQNDIINSDNGLINQIETEKKWKENANKILIEENNKRISNNILTHMNKNAIIKIIICEINELNHLHDDIKVIPINDNIYHWKVQLYNINSSIDEDDFKILKEKYGYDYVELDVSINPLLYPYYPPNISINKPIFKNGLSFGISTMNYFDLNNWNPTNSMEYTILSIKNIIEEKGKIDLDCDLNSLDSSERSTNIQNYLNNLAKIEHIKPLSSQLLDDIQIKYKANNFCQQSNAKSEKQYWKKGVGYGSDGLKSGFDINKYIKSNEEKQQQLIEVLDQIIINMQTMKYDEKYIEIIKQSCLLPFIFNKINEITIQSIIESIDVYRKLFNIIELFVNSDHLIKLFNININNKTIYDNYTNIYDVLLTYTNLIIEKNYSDTTTELCKKILQIYDKLTFKNIELNLIKEDNQQIIKIENQEEKYKTIMKQYQVDTMQLGKSSHYCFNNIINAVAKTQFPRIISEITSFESLLPLSFGSSIFIKYDEQYINSLRCLITGPDDTPYSCGCYIFDICIPNEYPNVPPLVKIINNGNFRFNPNLYAEGKVCLSLLGTWRAEEGESWIPNKSTIIQVLVSIQALILIDEPFYNEPGFEQSMNTPTGIKRSNDYNDNIRFKTLEISILNELLHPTIGFGDITKQHCYLKKKQILENANKWMNENKNKEYEKLYPTLIKQLTNELEKLIF